MFASVDFCPPLYYVVPAPFVNLFAGWARDLGDPARVDRVQMEGTDDRDHRSNGSPTSRAAARARLLHVVAQPPGRPARLSAMTGFHSRCEDEDCNRRCRRPGCLEPAVHFLTDLRRVNKRWSALHSYDCRVPFRGFAVINAARQAIEELNPNMTPSDVAVARRVIGKMLDRLEQLEHTAVMVIPVAPLLLTAAKRPHVVAAPRAETQATQAHHRWLAERKERTA